MAGWVGKDVRLPPDKEASNAQTDLGSGRDRQAAEAERTRFGPASPGLKGVSTCHGRLARVHQSEPRISDR